MIPTVDRADPLARLVTSLRLQTCSRFEVIVVVGPTSDHTIDSLTGLDLPLKIRHCPERNVSMARNIGIAAAAGDVVVFVDDDAVPEPIWLAALLDGFDDREVAAVGGVVFDNAGVNLQYESMVATRLGEVRHVQAHRPDAVRCFPGSWEFPYVPGGNGAYRRELLTGLGGFDEAIDYYLDETDVCVRLIDAGWRITPAVAAPIHHKHMESGIRNRHRVVTNWRSVVRSRAYFGCRHAEDEIGMDAVVQDNERFRHRCLDTSRADAAAGRMTAEELDAAIESAASAIQEGIRLAASGPRTTRFRQTDDAFIPFPAAGPDGHRVIVHLSRAPAPTLSEPERGVELHVIEPASGDASTVDLEGSVWRHRIQVGTGSVESGLVAELERLGSYRTIAELIGDVDHGRVAPAAK